MIQRENRVMNTKLKPKQLSLARVQLIAAHTEIIYEVKFETQNHLVEFT